MKNKKMELKVWADGIQRIVCGVNESTTCQDVVYALAHATGQTGRFTLVERWRSNERTLAPNEHPLKVLNKWGEYSNDVQFILKRSALTPKGSTNLQQINPVHRESDIAHSISPPLSLRRMFSPNAMHVPSTTGKIHQTKEAIKKSLTFTGVHQNEMQIQDSDRKSEHNQDSTKGSTQTVPSDDTREPIIGDDNSNNFHHPNDHSVTAYLEHDRMKDDNTMMSEIRSPSHLINSSPNHRTSDFVNKNSLFSVGENKRNLFPNEHSMSTLTSSHFVSNFQSISPVSVVASDGHRHHVMSPKSIHHHHNHHNHHHHHHHHHHSTPPPPPPPPPPSSAHSHSQGDLNRQLSPGNQHHSRIPSRPPPYPGHSTNSPKIFTGTMSPPPYRSPPTDKIQRFSSKNSNSSHSSPSNLLTPKLNEGLSSPASHTNMNNVETPKSRRSLYPQFQSQSRDPDIESKDLGSNGFTGSLQEHKFPDKQDSSGKSANQEVTKVIYDSRYRELVRLVNMQRDTLNGQHTQLTQYDAEISYWEEKQRERSRQAELMEVEIRKVEMLKNDTEAEVAHLGQLHLEEDLELGHQQERTLRSELTLLRSKLANCETELLQCKNKIRLLMDEASEERRLLNRKEDEDRDRERNILNEIESLQKEIKSKIQDYDLKVSVTSSEKLSEEIKEIEAMIAKKKKEVEELVHEMKEANLESLFIAPGDEIKHLDGGTNRPGSTRKIMGSPRELENAVPTSKNPHGVWV